MSQGVGPVNCTLLRGMFVWRGASISDALHEAASRHPADRGLTVALNPMDLQYDSRNTAPARFSSRFPAGPPITSTCPHLRRAVWTD